MLFLRSFAAISLVFAIVARFCSGETISYIGPIDEAKYIALDATNDNLLPNPNMVVDITKAIIVIRVQHPFVSNVRNNGPWSLGKLRVYNYKDEMLQELRESPYGPVLSAFKENDNTTAVTFTQPYHPIRLSERLRTELGINSDALWKTGPDYGEIRYIPFLRRYIFRQGLANCGANCDRNRYWVFQYELDRAILLGEFMTDIPIINRPPTPSSKVP